MKNTVTISAEELSRLRLRAAQAERQNASKLTRHMRLVREGLCIRCGEAPRINKSHCEECRIKQAAATKKRYRQQQAERRAAGLCLKCGAAPATAGDRCQGCQKKTVRRKQFSV